MDKMGPFHEAPGVISMRRVLAFFFAIAAVAVFCIAAFGAAMPAVYGGIALLCAVIVLLFFTTWQDVAEIAKSIRGEK